MSALKRKSNNKMVTERNYDEIARSLLADLGSKDKLVRGEAYVALHGMGESALPTLLKALADPDERVRWEARLLLEEIGIDWNEQTDPETIKALVNDLGSKDGRVRVRARQVLVAMGRGAINALAEALNSKGTERRWEAAKTLSEIAEPAAIAILVKALEDDVFEIRWLAAEGLITIGRPALVPVLSAVSRRPDSYWLREGVHRILHGIVSEAISPIIKPVLKALEDTEPELHVGFAAQAALAALRQQELNNAEMAN